MTGVIAEHEYLTRRLGEWTLLRAISLGKPWAAGELTSASDWCQRTATTGQVATSPEALTLLAEHGRIQRVRNAATRRLQVPKR